jgi:hypothetical protein
MPEAEVSIRLAVYLLTKKLVQSDVSVAIDGAQVRLNERIHFGLNEFLACLGWKYDGQNSDWRGYYSNTNSRFKIYVHSSSGCGDVVGSLNPEQLIRIECKGGPLMRSESSKEYPILREALGQLLTLETIGNEAVLAVAVPAGERFVKLAERWRKAPLVKRIGLQIITVSRSNEVNGLDVNAHLTSGSS